MKKKIMTMLTAAMCFAAGSLNCVTMASAADTQADDTSSGDTLLMGDVNGDSSFGVSDIVLFQKWLLAVQDANLTNWKAADFYADNKLDAFDLTLMKRTLLKEMNKSSEPSEPDSSDVFIGYYDENYSKPLPSQRIAMKCSSFCNPGETLKVDVAMGDDYSYHQEHDQYPNYDTTGHAEYGIYLCTSANYDKTEDEKMIINGEHSEYKREYTREEMKMLDISNKYDDYDSYHHETAEIDFSNYKAGSSGNIVFYFHWKYDEENPYNPSSQYSGMSRIMGFFVGEKGITVGATGEAAENKYKTLFGSLYDEQDIVSNDEIHFGYYDAAAGNSNPTSEIRIAMKCKAFCPSGDTLKVDVARSGFSQPQMYEGNGFLYKYIIHPWENCRQIEDERLVVNGETGGYEKSYFEDDRLMFNVGIEYDDYSTYHHEAAELDFQKYTAGSSGCIAFKFAALFYNDDGTLPEQPQSTGCIQGLYFYVGEDGVGISNSSVEDAEKAYQTKDTEEVTNSEQYTGRWHGKNISYELYLALSNPDRETIPVKVTFKDTGANEFVYQGRTIQEYIDDKYSDEDVFKLGQLLCDGDLLKYGETLYTIGTPDGIVWTKAMYDDRVEFFGEELLSKYIVDGEFLKEQLQADLKALKDYYQSLIDEAVEAFYQARIEETIKLLDTQGIRGERIPDTYEMLMYVSAAEFETLYLENASSYYYYSKDYHYTDVFF